MDPGTGIGIGEGGFVVVGVGEVDVAERSNLWWWRTLCSEVGGGLGGGAERGGY